MSCIDIKFRQFGCLSIGLQRVGGDLAVTFGLVCSTNLGEQGIIWASDGKLITLEGGYLIGA